VTEKV